MTPKNQANPNNIFPIREKDEDFSVDVFTLDVDGLLNVAYYNFREERWNFHGDTLTDPYENGMLIDFVWVYPPSYLKFP